MYRKSRTRGRPIKFKTWLGLWMDMKGFTIEAMARMMYFGEMSIKRWRAGNAIGRHAAQLMRSRWPDAPVALRGGHVPRLDEPLPINARTPDLYRYLFKKMGVIGEKEIAPIALERARGIVFGLKPEKVSIPSGEVNPEGV